jgi:hypothetical protein
MLFFVGQTSATSEQVAAGLGKHLAAVSVADYVKFQKVGYAASLLYIAALACAKVSTLTLLLALTPLAGHRKPIIMVAGLVVAWGVCALIASAFQCNLPHTWAYQTGKCFNQVSEDAHLILEFQCKCSPCRARAVICFVRFSNFYDFCVSEDTDQFSARLLGRSRRSRHLH